MTPQPIGPVLDGLGVTHDLPTDAIVEHALVVAKILDTDGAVAVSLYHSDGMSWLDELALITAARDIIDRPYENRGPHHD